MNGLGVKEYIPIIIAVFTAVATLAVSQYRIGEVEAKVVKLEGEPLRLSLLEKDVRYLRCEIRNVKRIIKNQPEDDCD